MGRKQYWFAILRGAFVGVPAEVVLDMLRYDRTTVQGTVSTDDDRVWWLFWTLDSPANFRRIESHTFRPIDLGWLHGELEAKLALQERVDETKEDG